MPDTRALALAGILLAAGAGLFLAAQLISAPEGVPDGATTPLGSATRVAVLVVHDRNLLRDLHAAIGEERVVGRNERAFALDEGRIVALEAPDAGPLIGELGWAERSVELIDASTLGGRDPRRLGRSAPMPRSDLARLSRQDTLSLGEAIRVLEATR